MMSYRWLKSNTVFNTSKRGLNERNIERNFLIKKYNYILLIGEQKMNDHFIKSKRGVFNCNFNAVGYK